MLTTAGPCLSTRSVKSGNWAAPASGTASTKARRMRLNMRIPAKRLEYRFTTAAPALAARRPPEFERVGDLHHRRRRRFAQHGHHVVRNAAHVDINRPLVRQALWRLRLGHRLDEYRHRRQAV